MSEDNSSQASAVYWQNGKALIPRDDVNIRVLLAVLVTLAFFVLFVGTCIYLFESPIRLFVALAVIPSVIVGWVFSLIYQKIDVAKKNANAELSRLEQSKGTLKRIEEARASGAFDQWEKK